MAIIGENLDLSLSNQIKVRQEKLGTPTLSTEDLAVFNSNTSWLRIASSVDITSAEAARLSDLYSGNILGNTLAKAFVLTGPSTYVDPNNLLAEPTLQSTLGSIYEGNSLEIEARTTYGIGSTKYGPTPPPGVESLTIKALNRGAIRKAQIKLKAYNPDQFRVIEALYCRLGFTILAEWGHSIYHQNNGSVRQDMYFTNRAYTNFLHRKKDFNGIVEDLENERKSCDHNYDGFIGYISNFNWNFDADGSYSITLDVINRGGLIDSLTASPSSINTVVSSSSSGDITENIISIGSYIKDFYSELKGKDGKDSYYKAEENLKGFKFIVDGEVEEFSMKDNTQHYKTSQAEVEKNFYYISLGCLLRLIETRCFPRDKNGVPVIKIEHGYSSTFMLSHPFQQSTNPEICRLSNSLPSSPLHKNRETDQRNKMLASLNDTDEKVAYQVGSENEYTPVWENSTPHPNLFREYTKKPGEQFNPFKADMMGIMLNLNFIVGTLNNNIDDEGKFNFYKTLKSILTEVNQCTGNLNSFTISYSEETNTIRVYDDTAIPNLGSAINTTPLQVFGITPPTLSNSNESPLKNGNGSFVTSLNFSSKIFPKIQNAVAIAAQNPDTPAGDQISSFQRLNQGIKDGIAEGRNTKISELTPPYPKYPFAITMLKTIFTSIWGNERKYQGQEYYQEWWEIYKELIQYDISWRIGEGNISSPFFIPVELNLEMQGISGFKLYNKFDITPDYILPPQYPTNVHFIVQGVEHTIQNNNWVTKIMALSWPATENRSFQYNGEVIMGDPAFSSPSTSNSAGLPTNPTTETPTQNTPQEESTESIFEDPSREPYIEITSDTALDNFGVAFNTRVSPAEAVALLHPQARAKQQAFLNNMLANPKLKGALIRISSTYRTFDQQKSLFDSGVTKAKPGRSPHNFGAAFDINILDQTTKKVIATNKIPAPKQSSKELWVMLGIVENATAAGVTSWGGYPNFSYHDPVHFGLKINKAATTKALNEYAQSIGKNDAFDLTIEEAYTVDLVFA